MKQSKASKVKSAEGMEANKKKEALPLQTPRVSESPPVAAAHTPHTPVVNKALVHPALPTLCPVQSLNVLSGPQTP